ncbi:MAG: diguanylate cyclase, partial [Oscillospiraceae bacterium]|nr:diguanylate cyclase [Oscillospiraceae bacterium]
AVFEETSRRDAEPWECFSAACGIAVYKKSEGDTVDTVFKRADDNMYENKVKMKAQRTD